MCILLRLTGKNAKFAEPVKKLQNIMDKISNNILSGEHKLLIHAVEQSANSVVITDEKGDIIYVNNKFISVSGYSRDEVVGKNTRILKSGVQDNAFYKDLWDKISNGKQWQGQFHNVRKNGEYFWEYATITPVFDENGSITHYLAIKEDITKRKEAEDELQKAREEIINTYKSKLEFLSVMSHEIRNPLNAIIGVSNLLMSDSTDDDQKQTLEALNFASDSLLTLIDDILDYSKFEAGKFEIEKIPFDITDVINKIVETWRPKAKEKGLRIETVFEGVHQNIIGDPGRIAQVLNNLISNAVKFTSEGSVIIGAKAKMISENEIQLELTVKDSGLGIRPEKLKGLFVPFFQGGADISRKYGGSGLGLAIVKKIIEHHGGKISVSSEAGKGTLFTISMKSKVALHLKKKDNTKEADNIHLSGVRVLLIEDNVMNIMLTRKWLKKWGAVVRIAETGKVAVGILNKSIFDIALVDLRMPDMDGFEIAAKIRKSVLNKNIPLIALTASVDEDINKKALDNQMNALIVKPFNPKKLLNTIFSKLQRKPDEQKIKTDESITENIGTKALIFHRDKNFNKLIPTIIEKYDNSVRSEFSEEELDSIISFLEVNHFYEEKESFYEWVRISASIHDSASDLFLKNLKKENLDHFFKLLKQKYQEN
ncbi:MAG: ATP-binding protein [Bacteroidales bacterium]